MLPFLLFGEILLINQIYLLNANGIFMRNFVFQKVKIKELMTLWQKQMSNDTRACLLLVIIATLTAYGSSDRSSSYQDERYYASYKKRQE